jgi:hypothetical protein
VHFNNTVAQQMANQNFSPIKEVFTYDVSKPFKDHPSIHAPKHSILKKPEPQQQQQQQQHSLMR